MCVCVHIPWHPVQGAPLPCALCCLGLALVPKQPRTREASRRWMGVHKCLNTIQQINKMMNKPFYSIFFPYIVTVIKVFYY